MIRKLAPLAALLASVAARTAAAQPVTAPADVPLGEVHDEAKLAELLAAITQDPAVRVDDPKARQEAQALMTEGVKRLQVQAYDQALANFLEAYNKLPSPKILLDVAATLRDMGRLADAANTYQRYLTDPATGPERVAEVKQLLLDLDQQLTILTVRVAPHGADVSIDAGPFVPVGASLQTRIRPGTHAIRVRKSEAVAEADINSFEGEVKDISVTVEEKTAPVAIVPTTSGPPTPVAPTTAPTAPTATPAPPAPPPENGYGWLTTGRTYGTDDGNGRARRVKADYSRDVAAFVPDTAMESLTAATTVAPEHIGSGVTAMMRIDGNHWKGFAGSVGLVYAATDHFAVEVDGMKSDVWGAYVGGRYLFLTGFVRPYAAAGVPLFFFTDDANNSQIAIGARAAGGVELEINGHFSVQADLGIEHYFNVDNVIYKMQTFETTAFVPTLGVIGRL